ncbi:MAG: bifunctional anthranilate synthase component II/anthranilate phosphoribosyltransferase [Spirochaetales bacterium]|nr:bifunctional anthranilate synthase component II/anthranilate phosphoribosyltransferase [Spirochaetales bacterium]
MYIIIDNYDSFTYNLYQYICEITDEPVKVFRNDRIGSIANLLQMKPKGIIISPGPGTPKEAGVSVDVIKHFAGKVPILGVCLGHQAIGYAFGAEIGQAKRIVHGKVEEISHDGKGVFRNIPSPAKFTRYHSLAIMKDSVPDCFEITATSADGEIMGVRHRLYAIEGIQFHPESIASEYGKRMLKNFLNYRRDSFDAKALLSKILNGSNLTLPEAQSFMEELTEGNLSDAQIAAFLIAINAKGASPEEIAGCASVLKKKRKVVETTCSVLDTCGTGGDGLGTFNISSFAALIAAACGARVAKHGNRAVSSKSGSADFYKELGINTGLDPTRAAALLEKTGFAFLFAPIYHQAMKYAGGVRRELKVKTIMNLVGPLSNPAGAEYQLIGVYSDKLAPVVARAAKLLGVKKVMTVHGLDGMDEISVASPTRVFEINENNEEKEYLLNPREMGIPIFLAEDLRGGDAKKNAELAKNILNGKGIPAIREAVALNAGAALYVAGLASDVKDGYTKAKEALESGRVSEKLDQIIRESNG